MHAPTVKEVVPTETLIRMFLSEDFCTTENPLGIGNQLKQISFHYDLGFASSSMFTRRLQVPNQ
jgi:hypothetical protein